MYEKAERQREMEITRQLVSYLFNYKLAPKFESKEDILYLQKSFIKVMQ